MDIEQIPTPNYGAPNSMRQLPKEKTKQQIFFSFIIVLLIPSLIIYIYISSQLKPPTNFPLNTPLEITPGMSVKAITKKLADAGVVQSDILLYLTIALYHDATDIKASTYIFDKPLDTKGIAAALTKGDFMSSLLSFTHIEGESVEDTANRAAKVLTDFNSAEFIQNALPYEGKLFPDTYLIPKDFTAAQLQAKMLDTYEEKIAPLRAFIATTNLTEYQVITLASIIEREANSPESMGYVAGILQNRLKKGMYLQVDASIEYILHKTLAELTPEDLKIDSPYNTYTNPGLPPTPIGNPGLTAINAVINPTPSPYLFYITGSDGTFHYARTFEEHKLNIARYLR